MAPAVAADERGEKPLKGILKKNTSTPQEGTVAAHSRRQRTEEENAEIARKHAAILQQRRELESAIFLDIERLTAFPLERGPAYSAAHPAPADAAAFANLVRIFQPGDYDDLIEERNTCGLCGYALCAHPRRTFTGGGTWKLVNAGRRDFGIVEKSELQKWCSSACARRALYIKVQLNETAAWERVGIPDIQVELYPEDKMDPKKEKRGKEEGDREKDGEEQKQQDKSTEARLAQDLARLKLHEERKLAKDQAALALERGDAVTPADPAEAALAAQSAIQPKAPLLDIRVMEKSIIAAPSEPSLTNSAEADAHMVMEGHKIRFGERQ